MNLPIRRAHEYQHVMAVKHELTRVPKSWLDSVSAVSWFILPDTLSPLWIGLMTQETYASDGRKYSECGGWYFDEHYDGSFLSFKDPHIYLASGAAKAAIHEVAHALERAWKVPVGDFYRPASAFYEYMATNPTEYFACALEAYLISELDDEHWNRADLATANMHLYDYLKHMET